MYVSFDHMITGNTTTASSEPVGGEGVQVGDVLLAATENSDPIMNMVALESVLMQSAPGPLRLVVVRGLWTTPLPTDVLLQLQAPLGGWIKKKPIQRAGQRALGRAKLRWFVLDGTRLRYFTSPASAKAGNITGALNLDGNASLIQVRARCAFDIWLRTAQSHTQDEASLTFELQTTDGVLMGEFTCAEEVRSWFQIRSGKPGLCCYADHV